MTPNGHTRPISPLIAAIVVYVLHGALFGGWLIDDAGISFAYARNLAQGWGLVSQPGMPPVEGFSNAFWTLGTAALYALGVFYLPWTPKLLALVLVTGGLVMMWRDLTSRTSSWLAVAFPLLLTAACTPFVVWTISGLENPLLAFLVVLSCTMTLRSITRPGPQPWLDAGAGAVAALAALTRPDALLYAPAYPLLVAVADVRHGAARPTVILRRWVTVVGGFVPVYTSYLLFRVSYFGEWVPNTYFAKTKPSLGSLLNPGKFLDLVESGTGDAMWIVMAVAAGAVAWLVVRRACATRTVVLLTYLGIASVSFVLMPNDWMGEFRFATSFFPLLYWTLADVAMAAGATLSLSAPRLLAWRVAVAVFAFQLTFIFAARSLLFASDPAVPLEETQRLGGHGFNRLAAALDVEDPSVLTPDLGGVLLESRMRVIDLAGLCDPFIARAQSISGDVTALHGYVFDTVKPTFIHTSGTFQRTSRLHEDPRLARDYIALHETWEGPAEWASFWRGRPSTPPWWADYVRREAVGNDPSRLTAIREVYQAERLSTFAPWRRPQDRLRTGWPQVAWAAATLRTQLVAASPPAVLDARSDSFD